MSYRDSHLERIVLSAAGRLIARATEARGVDIAALSPRIRATLNKYLLTTEPEASDSSIDKFLDELRADDLCLVIACEQGDETAWRDLVERFGPAVRSAAKSVSGSEDAAEDLAQSIWAELHGLRKGRNDVPSGKMAYYSGKGSLGGWLRAVVAQLAIDQHRKASRFIQMEEESGFDLLPGTIEGEFSGITQSSPDAEEALENRRSGEALEAALYAAIHKLDPEDRLLINLYYFDGLTLKESGAVLGVHEATASRRLSRAQAEIRNTVETILMNEHGWKEADVKESLAKQASLLDSDVQSIIRSRMSVKCDTAPDARPE